MPVLFRFEQFRRATCVLFFSPVERESMAVASPVGRDQLACLSLSRNTSNMAEWADSTSRSMTGTERRPARFFKEAAAAESSGNEFGILEDDRCIDTGVFQERYFLHELGFRLQPQISFTILTQADRCAVRTEGGAE